MACIICIACIAMFANGNNCISRHQGSIWCRPRPRKHLRSVQQGRSYLLILWGIKCIRMRMFDSFGICGFPNYVYVMFVCLLILSIASAASKDRYGVGRGRGIISSRDGVMGTVYWGPATEHSDTAVLSQSYHSVITVY